MGGTAMPSADGGRFGKPGDCPALDRFPTGSYPAVMGSSDEDAPDRAQLVQQGLADAVAALPRAEQAEPLIALARSLQGKDPAAAAVNALGAWKIARETGDAWQEAAARKLIRKAIPGYHAQVATNPVRLAAWDAALAAAIRPGMQALEIGVGCGILAMLAARNGAGHVTGCDPDAPMIAIAGDIVTRNGFQDRIRLIAKPIAHLVPGDLHTPAELLLLDLFADSLFSMQPFLRVREALPLLTEGAVVMPRRAELLAALAWSPHRRRTLPTRAAGFDVEPLIAAAPANEPFETDANRWLLSEAVTLVAADLPHTMPEDDGEATVSLTSSGGTVNGVVLWIRLELAEGHVIDARPDGEAPKSHAEARYYPFAEEWMSQPGEPVRVKLRWSKALMTVERIAD